MYPLGNGGILATSRTTEQTSLAPGCLHLLFSPVPGCLWDLGLRVRWWKEGRPTHLLRGPSHLAEVFGSDPIIITAGKLVHKRQHLVLCPDEL